MKLDGKRVLVVGLGRSGIAAARLCAARGARVTGTDAKPADKLALDGLPPGCALEAGGHRAETFRAADLIVVSPGVPPIAELAAARASGVPTVGELELASRFLRGDIVAITGTNGKSTTTSLAGRIVQRLGRPTFVGGNLGTPLCEAVGTPAGDGGILVVEVSSFQLETVETFHARAAALLNVTEDHLDRYPSMAEYAAAKARVFANQTAADFAVVHGDQPLAASLAKTPARVASFSVRGAVPFGAFFDGSDIVIRGFGADERYATADIPLHGRHNHENAMAAFLLARFFGVTPDDVCDATRTFRALPHRMEPCGEARGVAFFDDSKATNVGSVVKSLEGFPRPVVLIAGGRDKGGDYAPLRESVSACARAVVLIGEARARIAAALAGAAPIEEAPTLDAAVARACALARPGDAVVLSPACSSYDMFRNYEHRGQVFRDAVLAWIEGGTP